jgi:Na+-driven multidrug efflux pump/anti-sigma regulatory factor (Ser/Thr protein kinase)
MKDNNTFIRLLYRRCFGASMLAIFGSVSGQIIITAVIGITLGQEELSVIAITLPIYYIYATAGALLGVGGTTVCARLIGAREFNESQRAFTAVYLLTVLIAAVITGVILVFAPQIAGLLGVSASMSIYTDVLGYIRVLALGGVFIMSIYPAFNLLRLDGRNLAVIAIFAVMSAVNISAGIVLVLVLQTGVIGAAAATVTGAAAAGVTGAVLLHKGSKNFSFISAWVKSFKKLTGEIISAGSPSALENLCILVRTIALNLIIVRTIADLTALPALKIIDSANGVALVFIAGASGSLIAFAGVFSVEKDNKSIRQLILSAFKWGGSLSVVFMIICLLFPQQTAALLGMSGGSAGEAIRIFAVSLPLSLTNNIIICLYQASRRTAAANLLTLGRSLIWLVIAAAVLSQSIAAAGIWHSFWIAEVLTFISAVFISLVYRKNNKYLSPLFLLDTQPEVNGKFKSFSVLNTLEDIAASAAGIGEFCDLNDLPAKKAMAISVSIEELLVSIHEHGLNAPNASISVRLLIYEDMVIMRIRNCGKRFNPIEYYRSNPGESGSLGIKMVLGLAEKVHYSATFGVNNITVVI